MNSAKQARNESSRDETGAAPSTAANTDSKTTVTYSVSPGFVGLLARLNVSVALTSYQSGKFYLLGRNPKGGLMVNERLFQKAMGLHVEGNSLLLVTLFQIQRFENVLKKGQFINHTYDACYVPRTTYTTGILDAHDVGLLANGEIVFIHTRYNCLATTSPRDSFIPIWKPPSSNIFGSIEGGRSSMISPKKQLHLGSPRIANASLASNMIAARTID